MNSAQVGLAAHQEETRMSLSDRLKAGTAGLHAEMEALPFFRALADGSLPLDSYICQLRAFAVVFAALERSLDGAGPGPLRDLAAPLGGRYALLLRDLDGFADLLVPDVTPALQLALNLAGSIRQLGQENPRALAGQLYVLGGTSLGNRVHLGDVRRVLGGAGQGDAFYGGFGEETDERWRTLVALLDGLDTDAAEQLALAEAAQQTFRALLAIHAALYPLPPPQGRRLTAISLNPEAGNHPIPENLREVRSALAAGRRCREEFPYFDARYGERARRYTSSDVAWLATLPQLDTTGVIKQVTWLADLLARLGMPRILMERQLELLVEELAAQLPESSDRYRSLAAAAESLKHARSAHLPEPQFGELSEQLEGALAPGNPGIRNLGALIVASLTDEACGIPESAADLQAWLTGPGGFPAAAVRDAFQQGRDRIQTI
jgi:heme oxygenase